VLEVAIIKGFDSFDVVLRGCKKRFQPSLHLI